MRTYLTQKDVMQLASAAANRILDKLPTYASLRVWAVPRGGVPATYALCAASQQFELVDDPRQADLLFDDIIDSGLTMHGYMLAHPGKMFEALIDQRLVPTNERNWFVFPWEESAESSIEGNIVRLLQYVGEDPQRGGLQETPKRVAQAWADWTSGYRVEPASVLKTFEDGADKVDEMVTVRNIPFYSHCEHHMAPFFGTATIAYIPNGRIVGLSKLSRLTDVFARRLQVQERLTNQIADALVEHLGPKGVGVVVRARHMCLESRGVRQQGSETVTSALRGAIKDDASARAEFMRLL